MASSASFSSTSSKMASSASSSSSSSSSSSAPSVVNEPTEGMLYKVLHRGRGEFIGVYFMRRQKKKATGKKRARTSDYEVVGRLATATSKTKPEIPQYDPILHELHEIKAGSAESLGLDKHLSIKCDSDIIEGERDYAHRLAAVVAAEGMDGVAVEELMNEMLLEPLRDCAAKGKEGRRSEGNHFGHDVGNMTAAMCLMVVQAFREAAEAAEEGKGGGGDEEEDKEDEEEQADDENNRNGDNGRRKRRKSSTTVTKIPASLRSSGGVLSLTATPFGGDFVATSEIAPDETALLKIYNNVLSIEQEDLAYTEMMKWTISTTKTQAEIVAQWKKANKSFGVSQMNKVFSVAKTLKKNKT